MIYKNWHSQSKYNKAILYYFTHIWTALDIESFVKTPFAKIEA